MNSKFHKAQAEGLIKIVNESSLPPSSPGNMGIIALAQVHATLANVPDEED